MSSKNVVASVMQQSRQKVTQSCTEYRERPKATSSDGTTARRADDQRQSVNDVSVLCGDWNADTRSQITQNDLQRYITKNLHREICKTCNENACLFKRLRRVLKFKAT